MLPNAFNLQQDDDRDFRPVAAALAKGFNALRTFPDQQLNADLQNVMQQQTARKSRNKTIELLKSFGTPQMDRLAAMVQSGGLGAKDAYSLMLGFEKEQRDANRAAAAAELAFERQKELQSLKAPKTYQYQALAADILAQGLADTPQEALKMALANSNKGTTINMGSSKYGDPPKDTAWARGADGEVKLDDRGVPIALPIQGTKLFDTTSKIATKDKANVEETVVTGGVVLGNIDKIRNRLNQNSWVETILSPLGIKTGTEFLGGLLRNLGGTKALDIKSLIAPIQASIGFDRLQRMREASPTGGALGQVSERELDLLMATLSSLDQAQTQEQFLESIDQIEKRYIDIVRKFNAYPEEAMRAAGYEPRAVSLGGSSNATVINGYTIEPVSE